MLIKYSKLGKTITDFDGNEQFSSIESIQNFRDCLENQRQNLSEMIASLDIDIERCNNSE